MLPPGRRRQRLARALSAAYADGVLSQNTLVYRLELVFASPLIDPAKIIGDLPRRSRASLWTTARQRLETTCHTLSRGLWESPPSASQLLALDWDGGRQELVVGRHPACDIVLGSRAVSRRHARLTFRDEAWILQDLGSTNGTLHNGRPVGRCKLKPGDRLIIGDEHLLID